MDLDIAGSFEIGPIRPPSEAFSLLLRLTRNCPWNKCRFCHVYKLRKFEIRAVDEIKHDIDTAKHIYDRINEIAVRQNTDLRQAAGTILNNPPNESYYNVALWQYTGGENVFLQDGNSLVMPTAKLVDILSYLKAAFPGIKRITSYARSQTASRKTVEELRQLHEAGLSRLHLGLESGYDPLLQLMDKGVTAADHIKGGKNIVASGISLCEYVLLGLGGKTMWHEHAVATGRVLSEINPDYIRVRTLTILPEMLLAEDIENGKFLRSNYEDTINEERLLIENLNCTSYFVSDHSTNLLEELNGKLPDDKNNMLSTIDKFLALGRDDRINFIVGRRTGVYARLADMDSPGKRQAADEHVNRIISANGQFSDEIIWQLMERYI